MANEAGQDVSLLSATVQDIALLESFLAALRRDDPMPAHEMVDASTAGTALRLLLADQLLGRVWLIRSGGEFVGYLALTFVFSIEFGGRCAFIDELFIDAAHRGRGVGKAVMRRVCDVEAPALGVRALFLEVSEKNVAAAGLYRSVGFARREYGLMSRWVLKKDV